MTVTHIVAEEDKDRIAQIATELGELRRQGVAVAVDAQTVAQAEAQGKTIDIETGAVVEPWEVVFDDRRVSRRAVLGAVCGGIAALVAGNVAQASPYRPPRVTPATSSSGALTSTPAPPSLARTSRYEAMREDRTSRYEEFREREMLRRKMDGER